MVGFPLFAGFITKYTLIFGALQANVDTLQLAFAIGALVISTLLNTIYFLRTIITIYAPKEVFETKNNDYVPTHCKRFNISIIGFSIINIIIGVLPLIRDLIKTGLDMLS